MLLLVWRQIAFCCKDNNHWSNRKTSLIMSVLLIYESPYYVFSKYILFSLHYKLLSCLTYQLILKMRTTIWTFITISYFQFHTRMSILICKNKLLYVHSCMSKPMELFLIKVSDPYKDFIFLTLNFHHVLYILILI